MLCECPQVEALGERLSSEWQDVAGRMLADVNARVWAVYEHFSSVDPPQRGEKEKVTCIVVTLFSVGDKINDGKCPCVRTSIRSILIVPTKCPPYRLYVCTCVMCTNGFSV